MDVFLFIRSNITTNIAPDKQNEKKNNLIIIFFI